MEDPSSAMDRRSRETDPEAARERAAFEALLARSTDQVKARELYRRYFDPAEPLAAVLPRLEDLLRRSGLLRETKPLHPVAEVS